MAEKHSIEQQLHTMRALTGIDQSDFDALQAVADAARGWVDDLAQVFYDTLYAHPRTAAVFREGERPMREETLKSWYLSLFDTKDDMMFWNRQGRIAFAHIRRHVNNQFMIGMAHATSAAFEAKAVEALGPERGLPAARAFERIISSVAGLTAEGYKVATQLAFSESTGADPELVDRLIQESLETVQSEVLD